jgi:hypothetical protein
MRRVAILVLASLFLAACGSGGGGAADTPASDPGADVPVVADAADDDVAAADAVVPADPGIANDPGVAVDLGTEPDPGIANDPGVAVDPGIAADPGLADTPADPGTTPPAEGALGGACKADGACAEGTCQAGPVASGKICTVACLDNAECPDALRCETVTFESMVCTFGPRGTGGIGAPCGDEAGGGLACASGLCVEADAEQGIPGDTCTASCQLDTDCAPPFPLCFAFVNLCLPVTSGDLGGLCTTEGTCYAGDCTDLGADGVRCTKACTADGDCGAAWLECRAAGDGSYCLVKPGA